MPQLLPFYFINPRIIWIR